MCEEDDMHFRELLRRNEKNICNLNEINKKLECELQEKMAETDGLKSKIKELISTRDELNEKIKQHEEINKTDINTTSFMSIPDKVRIGSMDYDVLLTDEVLVLEGKQCYGTIDYDKHTIKISNNLQDKQGQEQTFLHELVHGIVRERSLDLQNSDDETITDEIAMGLHQAIRDNTKIFTSRTSESTELYVDRKLICKVEP